MQLYFSLTDSGVPLLDCPKCTGLLSLQTYSDHITLHRCGTCHGLWCHPESLTNMKEEWMSEAVLDTGDPAVGSRLNRAVNISCPDGHGLMERRSDPQQPHIWYEECLTCHYIFLDAGEFTDLKFKTLMDWLKKIVR
jgi:Zn-finger nucleic acid-binding protein